MNLVKDLAIADNWDVAYDQACAYGCRVDGHAVYCENPDWEDAPRKCRRTWYTGGSVLDEDCEGFLKNPAREAELKP